MKFLKIKKLKKVKINKKICFFLEKILFINKFIIFFYKLLIKKLIINYFKNNNCCLIYAEPKIKDFINYLTTVMLDMYKCTN